jgi:predicted DNA-binding transcriptional regulator YafY
MDPTARLLRLLSLLQTYRHWQGEELADRLAVSPRTLRRDVDRLRELGYPVDTTRGSAGGYRLSAGAQLPPLLLDDEEAVAIAVGLRTAAGGAVTGIEETSVRALAKLQQVLPARLRRRVQALAAATVSTPGWGGDAVDADGLVAIAQACSAGEQLRFHYTANDGSTTDRLVEPHRLVVRHRRWYLIAWDVPRQDWRVFRVDRVERPFANGVRVAPRELPAADAAAFLAARLRERPRPHWAVARLGVDVETARASVPRWIGELSADGADSTLLRVVGDAPDWLAVTLTMVGVPSELVEASDGVAGQLRALRSRVDGLLPAG